MWWGGVLTLLAVVMAPVSTFAQASLTVRFVTARARCFPA